MPGCATRSIGRRQFLAGTGATLLGTALGGCSLGLRNSAPPAPPAARLELPPLNASPDRITAVTVCTRPFRALGPRLDVEQIQGKTVVHNYGHGGSGWSLSWGSGEIAVEKAMATGEREVAVIGCGAIGLTTALLLQRAGASVTIYTKELPPDTRSSLATGVFTPDSRLCFDEYATPAFRQLWEQMARRSFATYQSFLGLPGSPVEFIDNYFVTDTAEPAHRSLPADDPRPRFAHLQHELLGNLLSGTQEYLPGSHPFGPRYVRAGAQLMFNLAAYQHLLLSDFLEAGGRVRIDEFRTPADFVRVRERTLINATGYGARALLGDRSLVPVRGQLARMIPQPDIHYGLIYRGVAFVPRRDGLVFQVIGDSDYYGFDDATVIPDHAEAERAVRTIADLFSPA
jgi:glycine/D-amino acid oxidase-like deaminating enzyme